MSNKKECIDEFNTEVRNTPNYDECKRVTTTKIVFFDDKETLPLYFLPSADGWATISEKLAEILIKFKETSNTIIYERNEEKRFIADNDFLKEKKSTALELIKKLFALHIQNHLELSNTYSTDSSEHVKALLNNIQNDIDGTLKKIGSLKSTLEFIDRQIFQTISYHDSSTHTKNNKDINKRKEEDIIRLKNEGKLSIKDICSIHNITVSRYYTICKHMKLKDYHEEQLDHKSSKQSYLKGDEIMYLKQLADIPYKSYTVPEMKEMFELKYKFEIPKSTLYYHLTKTLKYSFKRTHYKSPLAFRPEQYIINFKVSERLIKYMSENKYVIYIDEAGLHNNFDRQYSYAPIGKISYKASKTINQQLNIIVAITRKEVFAYTIRNGTFTELSIIEFLLQLTSKIYTIFGEDSRNVVIFWDNAPFHRSRLLKMLFDLLPFTIQFNGFYLHDCNPVENVHSIVKHQLRKIYGEKMYFYHF